MSLLDLFCSVDTFWQQFEPLWERELLATGKQRRRKRACRLSPSEIMTILPFVLDSTRLGRTSRCARTPVLGSDVT